MKAKFIDTGYYEVVDGDKWYTARRLPGYTAGELTWFVCNHRGRIIKQGSALYRAVVRTVVQAIVAEAVADA